MHPNFQKPKKSQKFINPKSFFFKKNACLQQDIYVY
jgi:hypothetical protein